MFERWTVLGVIIGMTALCLLRSPLGNEAHIVAEVVIVGGTAILPALAVQATRHRRLVRQLRARSRATSLDGTAVRVGDLADAAFVAGLGRPTIFCDRQLPRILSSGQLRAVLLHEQAHQRSRDPLRLLLLSIVAPGLRRLPGGRQRLANAVARREIAADRYALGNGATRADLSAALLSLPPLAHSQTAGFTPAIDQRLLALLDETPPAKPPACHARRARPAVTGLFFGVVLCAAFVHPVLAAVTGW